MEKLDYIPKTNLYMKHVDKSYSFGIDSILLANFSKMKKNKCLIDIGSGSGILSLACSSYYNLRKVFSIEIQKEKANLLKENIKLNGINNIEVVNEDLNKVNFPNNFCDYIITNPPYYKKGANIKNEKEEFLLSRQEIKMNLSDIFRFSNKCLKDKGKLFMIHKPERLVDIIKESGNLKLKRIKFVQSKTFEKPVFILMEFVKNANDGLKFENPLIIYDENNNYTKEVKEINGL
ncbi:methyltransferase [Anaerococcus sp. HMSC065G05]|uniref:tRNA1(Val) (adenine(37)-N6)-methyltransferase n=1 Tax=Anaerococcus sp. HMSC065G05 TaxID=1739356 RepID=UPI0008A31F4A|nr:methyltransferase [Anaerococcus sp. HMSC065G05]OFJ67916.1 methyltransferase [Anaerococcus sp. HMSC065G05]